MEQSIAERFFLHRGAVPLPHEFELPALKPQPVEKVEEEATDEDSYSEYECKVVATQSNTVDESMWCTVRVRAQDEDTAKELAEDKAKKEGNWDYGDSNYGDYPEITIDDVQIKSVSPIE